MSIRLAVKILLGIILALPFLAEIEFLGELLWGLGAVGFLYFDVVVGLLVVASTRMVRGNPSPRSWGDLAISIIILLVLVTINLLWLHNAPQPEA